MDTLREVEEAGLLDKFHALVRKALESDDSLSLSDINEMVLAEMTADERSLSPVACPDPSEPDDKIEGSDHSNKIERSSLPPENAPVADGGKDRKGGEVSPPSFSDSDESFERLAIPKQVMGRKASEVDNIRWVARHLELPVAQVLKVLKNAPSPEAVGLYMNYTRSDADRSLFWKELWPRILPNKTQLSRDGVVDVDGAHVVELINDIMGWRSEIENGTPLPEGIAG